MRAVTATATLFLLACRVGALLVATPRSSKAVLVVGGTGRVGGSTAKHLHLLGNAEGQPVKLILGGRSAAAFEASKSRILKQLASDDWGSVQDSSSRPEISFQAIDLDGPPGAVAAALRACGAVCVVHTAGPFQQRTEPVLLEACIACGLPYVDVCDEPLLCAANKALSGAAAAAGTVRLFRTNEFFRYVVTLTPKRTCIRILPSRRSWVLFACDWLCFAAVRRWP